MGLTVDKMYCLTSFEFTKGSYCVAFVDWANSNGAQSRVRAAAVGTLLHTSRRDP
jgi:hypothetical protein